MRVVLYTVVPQHTMQWSWHVSLDLLVDQYYWAKRAEKQTMYVLRPLISLGQALALQQALSARLIHLRFLEDSKSNEHEVSRQLLAYFVNTAQQLAPALPMIEQLRFTRIDLNQHQHKLLHRDCQHIQRRRQDHHHLPPHQIDANVAERLAAQLKGRAILLEELMDLLVHMGMPDLPWHSYLQWLYLHERISLCGGIASESKRKFARFIGKVQYRCRRCGSGHEAMYWSYCAACRTECPYCEACLTMGRTRYCGLLIRDHVQRVNKIPYTMQTMQTEPRRVSKGAREKKVAGFAGKNEAHNGDKKAADFAVKNGVNKVEELADDLRKWQLSPAQEAAVLEGLRFLSAPISQRDAQQDSKTGSQRDSRRGSILDSQRKSQRDSQRNSQQDFKLHCFLLWAVTGAGKTEMTFPLIAAALAKGGTVALTTPRRDVVLELLPRLQKAFPHHKIAALYGGSEQRWEFCDMMLTTTHQMMRFYRCFDLVIIDEVDAFPFKFNAVLETAVQQSCKPDGKYVLLSATPPTYMQKAITKGQLLHVKIPVRFHRCPLPVPKLIRIKASIHTLQSLPHSLVREINYSIARGSQVFLFVPLIKLVQPLVTKCRLTWPDLSIEGTSSKDKDRQDKVQAFRDGQYHLLVTTTILERGVTVPHTDVIVLDADSHIFDEAALVQMAGRSGRAMSDPHGKVCFFAKDRTRSQIKAVQQIKAMNRLAKKRGYLLPAEERRSRVSKRVISK